MTFVLRSFTLALLLTFATTAHVTAQPFTVERLSYLGGSGADHTVAVKIAANGAVVIAGTTTSTTFPTTASAYQRTPGGALDATLTTISREGAVTASTYLGSDENDELYDIAIDTDGSILVMVEMESTGVPVTGSVGTVEDSKRPMLLRFSSDLSTILAAFHFKIDHSIDGCRLSVAPDGRIAIVGTTEENLFPTTAAALQPAYAGDHDGLICVVNPTLTTLLYATFVGDVDRDSMQCAAFDDAGTLYSIVTIGRGDNDVDQRFIALSAAYAVTADRTEADPTHRSTTSMVALPTSILLGAHSTTGTFIDIRSPLGLPVRTITTTNELDVLTTIAMHSADLLVCGSFNGSATVMRLSLTNDSVLWTHRFGGSSADTCFAAAITASGLVTAGATASYDLPTTAGAYQATTADAPGNVHDHWFSLSTTSVPPKTVIAVTPAGIVMDSVILNDTRRDSVQCILVSGPSTAVISATLTPPVPGLSVTTTMPQSVTSSASPFIVVAWTPSDTTTITTTLRIATADTLISITVRGTARDTSSPPPPPPVKPRVTLSDVDLGVIALDEQRAANMYVRIDSVSTLVFDSVTVQHASTTLVELPSMPRAAVIPNDILALSVTTSAVGMDSVVVTLHYPDSTARGVIRWVVLQPGSAQWVTQDVDLGTVKCGNVDTALIIVRNIGSEAGEIRDIALTSDSDGEITLRHDPLRITVEPGASAAIMVIAAPLVPRDVTVRCVVTVNDDGDPSDTLSAQIRYHAIPKPVHASNEDPLPGDIVSGKLPGSDTVIKPPPQQPVRFTLDRRTVRVGDRFSMPLVCSEGAAWLRQQNVTQFTCTVTYRRSVLTISTPISDPVVTDGLRTVTITSGAIATSDTAARLDLTACLGDAASSDIVVRDIALVVDTGRVNVDTVITSLVSISDTWPSETPRHVSRDTTMPALEIYPNPVVDAATLSLHACAPGATVMVHAVDGRFVFEWTSPMTDGVRDVHITIPVGLSPGMYVCTYRSNDTPVQRSFVVLR